MTDIIIQGIHEMCIRDRIDAEQKLMRVYGEALAFQTRKFCFTALQPANRPIAGGFCRCV